MTEESLHSDVPAAAAGEADEPLGAWVHTGFARPALAATRPRQRADAAAGPPACFQPAEPWAPHDADVCTYSCLERPALLASILLGALVVAGGYAVHDDLRRLGGLEILHRQDLAVREYNYSRNVLVQQLAKNRAGRLAQLRRYAELVDRKQHQGVIVFTPEGGQAVSKVNLGGLRQELAHDIEEIEEWTPPLPMGGYDELRFEAAELLTGRLPVVLALAFGMASLVGWSTLAYRNLVAMHVTGTSFSPHTVPLLWLVPVANLFLPCAVMGEIWHGSDPRRLRNVSGLRLPIIGFWWPLVLVGTALVAIGTFRMKVAVGVSQMASATQFCVYGDIAAIIVGLMTLALVVGASWNQARRHRLLLATNGRLGPREAWRIE